MDYICMRVARVKPLPGGYVVRGRQPKTGEPTYLRMAYSMG